MAGVPKGARYGLRELQIRKVLTDPVGGTTTYGNPVKLSSAAACDVTAEIMSDQLRGDDAITHTVAQLDGFKIKIQWGEDDLDAESIILGGIRSDTGTDPNQVATLDHYSPQDLPHFMLEGRVVDSDNALTDYYLQIYNCQSTGLATSASNKKWGEQSADLYAIRRRSDNKLMTRQRRQTGSALATVTDAVAPTLTSTIPASGAIGVALSATPSWTFSKALLSGSVSSDNFLVVAALAGTQVAGTLAYNATNFTVTFTPTAALTLGTQYDMEATTGVMDLSGNRFAGDIRKFNT